MKEDDDSEHANGGTGAPEDSDSLESDEGVEIVTLADEGGRGVFITCRAEVSPADLVQGVLDLLGQVTRAALARPHAERAGDLGLGEDVF
ncbi:MAG: hypothetical protein M3362_07675 [Acidobacteriota bacterium]|nr:hypothetical protein [Acidobacteriota bacterium]